MELNLPLVPLRNGRVLFPGVVLRMQIVVGAGSAAAQLMDALGLQRESGALVACVPLRKDSSKESSKESKTTPKDPPKDSSKPKDALTKGSSATQPAAFDFAATLNDLASHGVAARLAAFRKVSRRGSPKDTYIVALEGLYRIKVNHLKKGEPLSHVRVTPFEDPELETSPTLTALSTSLKQAGTDLTDLLSQLQLPPQVLKQLQKTILDAPVTKLADLLASMIDLSHEEKLELLALAEDRVQRVTRVVELVTRQVQVLRISQKIQTTVDNKLGKQQREYILRQQLEAIKKELGESSPDSSDPDSDPDLTALKSKLDTLPLPADASKSMRRELARLTRMQPNMPEHQIIRNYLEWISEMPWAAAGSESSVGIDVEKARMQLDADHYGMESVKKRVLEYLAVGKLKKDLKGPILCLLGPPGVGKTSLGKSIATALGRKFHRISLGGVRDEAEIRGHRRTYIGALPGLIIQGMRKCGVPDPVFLLDEIDKLTRDQRGDPASALLEVLDPEQNGTFVDHYLNVPFDLSRVLFIATANEADTISAPLMDRMELIQLPGYTYPEKLQIARTHLLPTQLTIHGLTPSLLTLPDASLLKIATEYTRESGVRTLNRELAAVCRHVAVSYAQAKERFATDGFSGVITPVKVELILGPPRYIDEVSERGVCAGVVTGLAWTSSGSGGLLFIEAIKVEGGKGRIVLTGKLGDVIKESAQLGVSWVRANAGRLGLVEEGRDLMEKVDVHVHFPAGATPKDGPSAGIAIVTALVSLFSNRPVRNHLAMTGEMTLRGSVHPVGGVKEKILAAHRGGIQRVLLPSRNKKDLDEIPREVQRDLEILFVSRVEEVLELAFEGGFLRGGEREGVRVVGFEAKL
ncbi:ATP-dependent serine protease [Podochytrium sp. JEL0797]|nr:ATP-dependent serine protease [Podochytrium sp. JEL0797]